MAEELVHVVCLKFRQDADIAFTRKLTEEILALKSQPGVVSLELGPASLDLYAGYANRTAGGVSPVPNGVGFTHCLVLRTKGAEALEHYAKCPEHLAVVAKLKTVLEDGGLIAIDFFVAPRAKCPVSWAGAATLALGLALGYGLALSGLVPKM